VTVADCLITATGNGVVIQQNGPDAGGAAIRLEHNTIIAAGSIVLTFDEKTAQAAPQPAPQTMLEAAGNIFDANALLLMRWTAAQREPRDFKVAHDQLRHWLAWHDRRNLYAVLDHYLSMRRLPAPARSTAALKALADWHALWEAQDTGSLEGWPRYQSPRLLARDIARPEELRLDDFRLQPGSPGQGAGADGRDLGADVDLVGPGPAYELWKKTPTYQQWLRDTGRAK
jgi:hypothetical protein